MYQSQNMPGPAMVTNYPRIQVTYKRKVFPVFCFLFFLRFKLSEFGCRLSSLQHPVKNGPFGSVASWWQTEKGMCRLALKVSTLKLLITFIHNELSHTDSLTKLNISGAGIYNLRKVPWKEKHHGKNQNIWQRVIMSSTDNLPDSFSLEVIPRKPSILLFCADRLPSQPSS